MRGAPRLHGPRRTCGARPGACASCRARPRRARRTGRRGVHEASPPVPRAGEHLGDVLARAPAAAPVQAAVHVHAAAHVGDHDRVGAAGLDGVELAVEHRAGDVGHLDREQAAEAAADVGLGQRHVGGAARRRRAAPRLRVDAEAAQAVAAGVIGERARRRRADVGDAEHSTQKLRQLVGPRAPAPAPRPVLRSSASSAAYWWITMSPHDPDGTTTGSSLAPSTSIVCRAIARASQRAGVEGRLTAAGLLFGNVTSMPAARARGRRLRPCRGRSDRRGTSRAAARARVAWATV